jgi:hypothetical protein
MAVVKNGVLKKIEEKDIINGEYTTSKDIKKIGFNVLADVSSLKRLIVTEDVEEIEAGAFTYCESIEYVKLPKTIKEIPDNLFEACARLIEVDIPDSVTEIGMWAFRSCINIKKIKIPKELKAVGILAFENCESLKEIVFHEWLETIGDSAFSCCKKLEAVIIKSSKAKIGDKAFIGCESLRTFNTSSIKGLGEVFDTSHKIKSIIHNRTHVDIVTVDDTREKRLKPRSNKPVTYVLLEEMYNDTVMKNIKFSKLCEIESKIAYVLAEVDDIKIVGGTQESLIPQIKEEIKFKFISNIES